MVGLAEGMGRGVAVGVGVGVTSMATGFAEVTERSVQFDIIKATTSKPNNLLAIIQFTVYS
jgi:hypothetical protein